METTKLIHWAEIQKGGAIKRRELSNELFKHKLDINCEWQLCQHLQRVSFRRGFRGRNCRPDLRDKEIEEVCVELGLSPSTVYSWYYRTFNKQPVKINESQCNNCRFNKVCEKKVDIKHNVELPYTHKLVLRRLKQFIVKKDIFHKFVEDRIGKISDDELRISLRRITETDYVKSNMNKEIKLTSKEIRIKEVIEEYGIKAVTAARYYYILKKPEILLEQTEQNEIQPEEVMRIAIEELSKKIYEVRI